MHAEDTQAHALFDARLVVALGFVLLPGLISLQICLEGFESRVRHLGPPEQGTHAERRN